MPCLQKHCNLLLEIVDYISGLFYKQVTFVIYNHNDCGQYYKTTITIVIDDRQLQL